MLKFLLLTAACLIIALPASYADKYTSFSFDTPPLVTPTSNTDTNLAGQVQYCYPQYDYYLNTGSVLDTSNTMDSVNNYNRLYNQISMDSNSLTDTTPYLIDSFKNNELGGANLQTEKIDPIKAEKENIKPISAPSATNLSE